MLRSVLVRAELELSRCGEVTDSPELALVAVYRDHIHYAFTSPIPVAEIVTDHIESGRSGAFLCKGVCERERLGDRATCAFVGEGEIGRAHV